MSGITFGTKQFSDAVQSIRSFAKEETKAVKQHSKTSDNFDTELSELISTYLDKTPLTKEELCKVLQGYIDYYGN